MNPYGQRALDAAVLAEDAAGEFFAALSKAETADDQETIRSAELVMLSAVATFARQIVPALTYGLLAIAEAVADRG